MRALLTNLKNRFTTEADLFGREILVQWFSGRREDNLRILDVGCGSGADLLALKKLLPNAWLFGVDIMEASVKDCLGKGICARRLNLEEEEIPYEAEYFDIVIANQVFEHLKNWIWALFQISGCLKAGGSLFVGVPNLASLHNRILLLFGEQPRCINTMGMHVRGFTAPGLRRVLEYRKAFHVEKIAGRPFYPFPRGVSSLLAGVFPRGAASIFLLCRKTGDAAVLAELESMQRREEFRVGHCRWL